MSGSFLAWHFLPDDGRLGNSKRCVLVRPGQLLKRDPSRLMLCSYGLHWSRRAIDALNYAPGPIVEKVRVGGRVVEHEDKGCSSRRTCLALADASAVLRLWGCWCVRQVWHLLTDERSRRAVEVSEAYAVGEVTGDELDAARAAAWDTAWDTAWAAAWDTAWAAASDTAWAAASDTAKYAAWAAARDTARVDAWVAARYTVKYAAWAAAWDTARVDARAAAWDTAWDTAWAAAWDTARDTQNAELERRLLELLHNECGYEEE